MQIPLLVFGVLCCSTAALFLKASHLDPAVLSAYRLLTAAVLLSPLFVARWRQHRNEYGWRHVSRALLPATILAIHFVSYAQGTRWTEAANATLIGNLGPVVMPFLLYFVAQEKITKGQIFGTCVAMVGVGLLTLANVSLGTQNLLGDAICFVSMFFAVYYLFLGRVGREIPSIWLYVVPLYAFAGVFCLLIASVIAQPFQVYPLREYGIVLGLAIVPTCIAHSIFNATMRQLSGQIVPIFNLFQFVATSGFAFLLYHTKPQTIFYPASAIILAGALLVLRSTPKSHSLSTATQDA